MLKNKRAFKILLLFVVLSLLVVDYITTKYTVVNRHNDEYRYITIRGDVAVPPTVIDYKVEMPYMFGLRLNINMYACEVGPKPMLGSKPMYFILNLNSGNYRHFIDKNSFDSTLKKLNVSMNSLDLDSSLFDFVLNKQARITKSYGRCKQDLTLFQFFF
jgi:hypothetical protein